MALASQVEMREMASEFLGTRLLREASVKLLKEEQERRRKTLAAILDEHGWVMDEKSLDSWLDIIEDFNEKMEE